jgi:predicted small lipoprotein YifL
MTSTALYKIIKTFIIILTLGSITGCGALLPLTDIDIAPPSALAAKFSANDPAAIAITSTCRSVVDGFAGLTQGLDFPEHYMTGNFTRQPGDFDPNDYFKVLTHLKIAPGYTLDYVFFGDSIGGKPLIYARKFDSKPFENYKAFVRSYGEPPIDEYSFLPLKYASAYVEKIQPDQSPESYFQFLALALLGDQFYLSWHALYNDQKILCDASDLETIDQDLKMFMPRSSEEDISEIGLPQEVIDQVAKINLQPLVLVNEKTVTIRFVSFTKWGGFIENIFVMDKKNLKNPIDTQSNVLIEYDCGVMF